MSYAHKHHDGDDNKNNPMPGQVSEEGEPNPDEFRVSAADNRGHSAGTSFRMQPGHDMRIRSIVGSGLFPYRTNADLIRHAIKRHIDWLETLSSVSSVTKQVDAIIDIARNDEFQGDFKSAFDHINKQVSNCLSVGQVDRARNIVLQFRHHIGEMPEGYWKEMYQKEFNEKYDYLVNSQPSTPPENLLDIS